MPSSMTCSFPLNQPDVETAYDSAPAANAKRVAIDLLGTYHLDENTPKCPYVCGRHSVYQSYYIFVVSIWRYVNWVALSALLFLPICDPARLSLVSALISHLSYPARPVPPPVAHPISSHLIPCNAMQSGLLDRDIWILDAREKKRHKSRNADADAGRRMFVHVHVHWIG